MAFSLPPLVYSCLKTARKYHSSQALSPNSDLITRQLKPLYQFVFQTLNTLSNLNDFEDDFSRLEINKRKQKPFTMDLGELTFKLCLHAAQSADETGLENMCYEFLVKVKFIILYIFVVI